MNGAFIIFRVTKLQMSTECTKPIITEYTLETSKNGITINELRPKNVVYTYRSRSVEKIVIRYSKQDNLISSTVAHFIYTVTIETTM